MTPNNTKRPMDSAGPVENAPRAFIDRNVVRGRFPQVPWKRFAFPQSPQAPPGSIEETKTTNPKSALW